MADNTAVTGIIILGKHTGARITRVPVFAFRQKRSRVEWLPQPCLPVRSDKAMRYIKPVSSTVAAKIIRIEISAGILFNSVQKCRGIIAVPAVCACKRPADVYDPPFRTVMMRKNKTESSCHYSSKSASVIIYPVCLRARCCWRDTAAVQSGSIFVKDIRKSFCFRKRGKICGRFTIKTDISHLFSSLYILML